MTNQQPHPQPQAPLGEAFDVDDVFSLDDDAPLNCPLRKSDDEGPCESCQ